MAADMRSRKKSHNFNSRWRKRQTICTFAIDSEGIDLAVMTLRSVLTEAGYRKKDALRLAFALDALLFSWFENGLENASAELYAEKIFGHRRLIVDVRGKVTSVELTESVQTYPWQDGLRENGLMWSSTQASDGMRAELVIYKRGMASVVKFLIAVAAAVATVLILSALPGDALSAANKLIFNPLFNIGAGLLTALAGLMVFFSIMSGVMGVGDIRKLRQIGSHSFSRIMQANTLGLILGTFGAIAMLGTLFSFSEGTVNFGEDILKPFFSIIPTSFFQPFIDGSIVQITIWGIIFGVTALMIKTRIPAVGAIAVEINSLVQQVVVSISRIMPNFVYLAFVTILSNITGEAIFQLLRMLAILVLAAVCISAILLVIVLRRSKLGSVKTIKKMLPVLKMAFITSSTAASYSQVFDLMKKFSVEESVLSFHTPIAVSIAHPGCILDFMMAAALTACLGDYTIGVSQLILMLILCFILGFATPSSPGGAILIYALMFSSMGFDLVFLPLVVAINPVVDMVCTTVNVIAIIATGLQVDSDLKSLPE